MKINGRFPHRGFLDSARCRQAWRFALPLLAAAYACAQEPASFPLLKSCGAGAEAATTIRDTDAVQIRYGYSTDAGTCYAVAATAGGQTVDGYLLRVEGGRESQHPAVAAFELELRTHLASVPMAAPLTPAPPVATMTPATPVNPQVHTPGPNPSSPTEPLSFAGFRAVDVKGNRVDLSMIHTPTVVLYFWSAADKRGIQKAEDMENIYEQYHPRGVDVVGVASARSASQLLDVCHENALVWPQIFDSGSIADRYHVDPAKPYLVLDQSRRVIASASSPLELDPVLQILAQRRRLNQ